MSDRFHPISMEQLTDWVFDELEDSDSLFGVPQSAFFVPSADHRFRTEKYGVDLDTPIGVAAGPQTQMAQNLIVSWLVGARFLELKTVQTLDDLDVAKPCIDVEDEGYNVEWSQELKIFQSFDEYLRAWVLIHALHHKFGWYGDAPGVIFNMSVGYNLDGMLKPNVQWYFDAMSDSSEYLGDYIDIVAKRYPAVKEIDIPAQISDTITLSTMHGCPPEEIESISLYLMEEKGLHTSVKCNPTLLGADRVRTILNDDLGFTDVVVPDEAFGHDLKYVDAVPMFHNLKRVARREQVTFGVKLSNTLEVNNWRDVFEDEEMMYLSGRALHALTSNLAAKLSEEFRGDLLMSFAGGADAFNVAGLLAAGMKSVTVSSDLLKTGGYLRLIQYIENIDAAMDTVGAVDTTDLIAKTALTQPNLDEFAPTLWAAGVGDSGLELSLAQCRDLEESLRAGVDGPVTDAVRSWAIGAGFDAERADVVVALAVRTMARINLRRKADDVRVDWRYQKHSFRMNRSKTDRKLGHFDCIEAPCNDECPVDQRVPDYMEAVREGRFDDAIRITRADNPMPSVLGRVCTHYCEDTCIRTHLDQPLAIRHMKRFIMGNESEPVMFIKKPEQKTKVAIIGAGPAGVATAEALGYAGFAVTVFEAHPYSGGMVGGAIPSYRLPRADIDKDMAILSELGVEIRYDQKAGVDFTLADLRSEGFSDIVVAVGAQLAKKLNLPGEDAEGVIDGISFLRSVREETPMPIGARVGVIGAGDTAMDCVRSARRVGAEVVNLIYRRTIDQMPADPEEIHESLEEGINIIELASPAGLVVSDGRLTALTCTRTEYRGERDASGRNIPFPVDDSDFDIELDTLILAISQHSVLDFFGDEAPSINKWGYIEVDPDTYESSIPGLYAAGDVAADGPSSIVEAAKDGKALAAAIIAKHGAEGLETTTMEPKPIDLHEMVLRRARREYRTPISYIGLEERDGFTETVLNYTESEAQAEASRCLDCDDICSLCVGVCPNMALMTYQMDPVRLDLPTLGTDGGKVTATGTVPFAATQGLQIAVLTDFCNECGNCVTVCPTSGRPYVDKPRLYLDRPDFEAQSDNAFMMMGGSVIESRVGGETHRLEVGDQITYTAPGLTAVLDAGDFSLVEATGEARSLEPAAVMYTVLRGVEGSMSHVPVMADAGTVVTHPGYPED